MAKSAHLLSQTDVNGTSALNRLLATQGGGSIPAADGRRSRRMNAASETARRLLSTHEELEARQRTTTSSR
jgi:hypothetical protein